ncbi:hypothetical protein O3G_MSEX008414 [Manduca sexta]|uniref:MADF domain-containing protein n=1 Tax=Manduca sexta TaxID=7130 RepID=A0A921ZAA3_MANSE|nr:hypothetical protein O3G_MSEX008414 [Manduca sexta]
MEWSNEKALEFIQLFRTEPCLWDPQLTLYKNRSAQHDAWRRIRNGLPFPTTIDHLKKKKESLLGYYRIHLNKYKKSLKSDGEVYKTNWFAFEAMDDFLRPVYDGKNTSNTGGISDATASEASEDQETDSQTGYPSLATSYDDSSSSRAPKRQNTSLSNNQPTEQHFIKKKIIPELIAAKKQMDVAFDCMESITQKQRKEFDEFDHFGLMIAAKIRKINDSFDKEALMNTIQNLVFEAITKNDSSCLSHSQNGRQSRSYSPSETKMSPLVIIEER